jgi:outer membrane protein OmpA-like peptidoglycan-associated protein
LKYIHLIILFISFYPNWSEAQLYKSTTSSFTVHFDSDVSELSEYTKSKIRDILITIGPSQIRGIEVVGHTDTFADADYNLELSAKRSLSVLNYLQGLGYPARLMKQGSKGETEVVALNTHQKNRRVEIKVSYETTQKSASIVQGFLKVKLIDARTKKPLKGMVLLSSEDKGVEMSYTNSTGWSKGLPVPESAKLSGFATGYLSTYVNLTDEMLSGGDTSTITLELEKVKVLEKLTYSNIYFFTDRDEIRPESSPDLYKLLALMQRNKSAIIEIQGHMNYPLDWPKSPEQAAYNLELSFKRAKAINDFLIKSGVDQNRLTYKGMSNFRMVHPYASDMYQQNQNKRVEVYLLKKV